jgi:hypothetical protein
MFWSSNMWFNFNLHRKNILFFLLDTHIIILHCNFMIYLCKKGPLTWNGSFLDMVVNPYPWWSLAQSQLPHFKNPHLTPTPFPFPPSSRQHEQYYSVHTDDIQMAKSSSVGHIFIPYYFFFKYVFFFYLLPVIVTFTYEFFPMFCGHTYSTYQH